MNVGDDLLEQIISIQSFMNILIVSWLSLICNLVLIFLYIQLIG